MHLLTGTGRTQGRAVRGLPGMDCSLPSLGQARPQHPPPRLALKPPTPAVPFTCLFFSPAEIPGRGVGGDESCRGGPGRGGDRLSGILYSCSNNNTNSGRKQEGENQTIKTARGLIPIQSPLFVTWTMWTGQGGLRVRTGEALFREEVALARTAREKESPSRVWCLLSPGRQGICSLITLLPQKTQLG